ncbi:MAG: amino acid ABC transporter permease [Hyphomicrobiales bacterium]
MSATSEASESAKIPLWNDPRVRAIVSQSILVIILLWLGYEIVSNTIRNLEQQKIASGFGFLSTTAGFGIIMKLVPYNEASSYGRAFVVGLLNTLVVSIVGIFLATILGFVVGIMRLSHNWIIAKIAYVYVEVMRNIPLLLQIIVWYGLILGFAPDKRSKWSFLDLFHFNISGIRSPAPIFGEGFLFTVITFFIAIAGAFYMARWAHKRQDETGQPFPVFWVSLGLIIGLPLLVFLITGAPLTWEYPNFVTEGAIFKRGFEIGIGSVIIPEFIAMLLALTTYTAGFIAENVRAGILAVSHGQSEAAGALGLRRGQALRLVVIPQAARVIIPPLTSQYLNLTKNSSLAVGIAYPDLVAVGGTVLNQTGQAIEIIGMWMLIYLSISLATSAFMNWYNAKMALVER